MVSQQAGYLEMQSAIFRPFVSSYWARMNLDSFFDVAQKTLTARPRGPLHVGRPNVLDESAFIARVKTLLENRNFSNDGPFVKQLEAYVSEQLGVPHVMAVANATLGIELVLEALELKGQVILPSFTFVATAHAVMRQGLSPVFCDVTAPLGLIDPVEVERKIGPETKAILAVNVYGNVCDIEQLTAIADKYSLKLIFDSAHALGVKYQGVQVGGNGHAEVFSLHATKFVNGFEGGLITTHSDELARKIRLLKNFGFVAYDEVECVGTNAKLSEIHAAMALTNFEHIEKIMDVNRRNYADYARKLPSWLSLIEFPENTESNYQYVVAICSKDIRNKLVDYLHSRDILVRKYFYPGVHRMKPYAQLHARLPVTEQLAEQVICLPTGQSVNSEVIDYICGVIKSFEEMNSSLKLSQVLDAEQLLP
jgi:dTDP-4-amino-4,6-dideoxygalactose transaminase